MGLRVRLVSVLERHEEGRVSLGQLERESDGAVRALLARREDELGAVEREQALPLVGRILRHDARERIPLELRHEREGDARVPARRLEEAPPWLELPGGLGSVDHRLGDAVLDRAGRVLTLELGVDRNALGGEARQLDEWCVPHEVEERGSEVDPLAAGHRRQQDHGRALGNLGLEAVERPHVLALDVDVDEGRDLAVGEDLAAEARKALGQIVEQVADGLTGGLDLPRAAGRRAEGRGDADGRHQCTSAGRPWQNST